MEQEVEQESLEARAARRAENARKFEFEKALENWGGRNRKAGSWMSTDRTGEGGE